MADPTVTVLHARGALDIDSGDVIDGAYVCVEGSRITSVGTDSSVATDADEVVELPELTLLPGLMDMEVDLVLGGPGRRPDRPGDHRPGQDDPAGDRQRPADAAGRVHDGPEPGAVRQDRRLPARRGVERGGRERLDRRSPHRPGRPRHLPDGRPPRPERAERPGAAHDAAVDRGGDRRRRRRRPQGGPLPDQARGSAHQVLRLGGRGRLAGAVGGPAVLERGAGGDRRRGPPARASGSPPTATATPPSTPPSTPASTASSTGS